jgi:hypothetical protein
MRAKVVFFGFILAGLGCLGGGAGAAPPTGLTVSPAFQMVTIRPGAAEQPVSFRVTNDRPVAQDLSLSVRDFNTLNESGGLFFVGTNPTALQKKYGLAKWVSLPTDHVIVQPKQTITLKASILNLPDLSAGGHYGALMISLGGNSGGGRVGLQPIASSLLFVTKPQGATHQLSLSGVDFSHGWLKLPDHISLRFQNTGNTHVVPRGGVYLRDSAGRLISKGIINQNSNIILPETYRRYDVPLTETSSAVRPGKYSLRVDFRFDGISQYRSYQADFWYFSFLPWLGGVMVIIIIAALMTWPRRKNKLKRRANPSKKT